MYKNLLVFYLSRERIWIWFWDRCIVGEKPHDTNTPDQQYQNLLCWTLARLRRMPRWPDSSIWWPAARRWLQRESFRVYAKNVFHHSKRLIYTCWCGLLHKSNYSDYFGSSLFSCLSTNILRWPVGGCMRKQRLRYGLKFDPFGRKLHQSHNILLYGQW